MIPIGGNLQVPELSSIFGKLGDLIVNFRNLKQVDFK